MQSSLIMHRKLVSGLQSTTCTDDQILIKMAYSIVICHTYKTDYWVLMLTSEAIDILVYVKNTL